MAIFRLEPPTGAKKSRPISVFGIDDCLTVVNSFDRGVVYNTKRRRLFIAQTVAKKRHVSVNLVYDSKP